MCLSFHWHQVAYLSDKVDWFNPFLEVVSVCYRYSQDFQVLFFLFYLINYLIVWDQGCWQAWKEIVFHKKLWTRLSFCRLDCLCWWCLDRLALGCHPGPLPCASEFMNPWNLQVSIKTYIFFYLSNIFRLLPTACVFFQFQHTFHGRFVMCDKFSFIKLWFFCFNFEFVFSHFKILRSFLAL